MEKGCHNEFKGDLKRFEKEFELLKMRNITRKWKNIKSQSSIIKPSLDSGMTLCKTILEFNYVLSRIQINSSKPYKGV